ncbi:hypothetical protein D3C87_18190 [compost metagenome]
MRKILLGLISYHLIPIAISLILLFFADYLVSGGFEAESHKETVVSGVSESVRGSFSNCTKKQAEIELMGSLQSKDKLTVLGSSELQDLPYTCYYFLPDSLGIKTTGFGHAYHQNLSIACELLAAGDRLNNANVCVILSPGWFQTEGTNIEAFLEFVRPNFLRSIIHDSSIPEQNKLHIANYVWDYFKDINNPSRELLYFRNMWTCKRKGVTSKSFTSYTLSQIEKVKYAVTVKQPQLTKPAKVFQWEKTKDRLQKEFLKTCTNNNIYVDSFYFKEYLLVDGVYEKSRMQPLSPGREFEDFKLVVEILKRHNCHATFVLQPYNPHHQDDLSQFNPVRNLIKKELTKAGFPLLDLYVTDTKSYTPGILKDIMHPGDRGWMEINWFLAKHYKKLHE